MAKKPITEDAITQIGKSISLGDYFTFFRKATGKDLQNGEHTIWLGTQVGKTVVEALVSYNDAAQPKTMEQKLLEERFNIISEADKAFIVAFDKAFEGLGYDYGGGIGRL